MAQYFVVHRGTGTFMLIDECEIVKVSDKGTYESVEDLGSDPTAVIVPARMVVYAAEDYDSALLP